MGWLSDDDLRIAAGNLLSSYLTRESTREGSQGRIVADIGFTVLCEVGARAGLAETSAQLELMVRDVVEQLPPPGGTAPIDGGPDWTWLMQARFILARRLGARSSAVAA